MGEKGKIKMRIDTRTVKAICDYRVIENCENYCMVEMYGRRVRVDRNGCASERDLCFIDGKGLPHSAGYLKWCGRCELDRLDNALMADFSPNERRIVQEWIRDTFNPIKTYNKKHSTYSLKHLLQSKTGIYLTNNQMKDALLKMGYICQNEHKINWLVNVSEMGIKYVK